MLKVNNLYKALKWGKHAGALLAGAWHVKRLSEMRNTSCENKYEHDNLKLFYII